MFYPPMKTKKRKNFKVKIRAEKETINCLKYIFNGNPNGCRVHNVENRTKRTHTHTAPNQCTALCIRILNCLQDNYYHLEQELVSKTIKYSKVLRRQTWTHKKLENAMCVFFLCLVEMKSSQRANISNSYT